MLRCTTPVVFLRLVALASAVAVIYSEGSQNRRHRLVLPPSQQLATSSTPSYAGNALQHKSAEIGGGGRRTSFLAFVEDATGGKDSVSLRAAVREASDDGDGSRTEETTRQRRTAESKAPTPAATGPFSGFPPTTTSTTITNPLVLAPSFLAEATPAPAVIARTAQPITEAPEAATPAPVKETPAPTALPASIPPPTIAPTPVPVSPAPTALPATPTLQPTMKPTPVVLESPAPTALPATLPAVTLEPTTKPTSRGETPAPSFAAEPTTLQPTAATDVAFSPAPQTSEEELSPTRTPVTAAVGVPGTDTDSADTPKGGIDTDDSGDDDTDDSVEAKVSGSGEATDDSGDGVGFARLDSDEKANVVIGISVIGSLAVVLMVAACAAKRYNASVSGLDEDDDDEDAGLAKGRPGRLQTRKELPTYRVSPGSRTER